MLTLAAIAALIADPARAAMLQALLAGQALTAGELARIAGVAPSTASGHLARLAEGGLVTVHPQGRHRYIRLSGEAAAEALESLLRMTEPPRTWRHGEALRTARTCYDHLAGRLGVALRDALAARAVIAPAPGGWEATASGEQALAELGVDLALARRRSRFACDCMDWSERTPHLAGGLAAAICSLCLERRWLTRAGTEGLSRRTLVPTPEGRRMLRAAFGVSLSA